MLAARTSICDCAIFSSLDGAKPPKGLPCAAFGSENCRATRLVASFELYGDASIWRFSSALGHAGVSSQFFDALRDISATAWRSEDSPPANKRLMQLSLKGY